MERADGFTPEELEEMRQADAAISRQMNAEKKQKRETVVARSKRYRENHREEIAAKKAAIYRARKAEKSPAEA